MTLKKLTGLTTLVAFFCLNTGMARAEVPLLPPLPPLQLNEPSVGKAISPLKMGQKAPFTGLLLSPEAIADMIAELNSIPEQIEIEKKKTLETCEAQCTFKLEWSKIESNTDNKILNARVEAEERQNKILVERVKELEDDKSNLLLWTAGGAVVGVLTTILIVFGVSAAENSAK